MSECFGQGCEATAGVGMSNGDLTGTNVMKGVGQGYQDSPQGLLLLQRLSDTNILNCNIRQISIKYMSKHQTRHFICSSLVCIPGMDQTGKEEPVI